MSVSVLVVDDDDGFRSLARRILEGEGMTVAGEAGTVEQALELAWELRPRAVLVDVGLPDGDGVSLTKLLSALPWRPRVLVTSSDRDATTGEAAVAAGAVGFVAKADLPDAEVATLIASPDDGRYG